MISVTEFSTVGIKVDKTTRPNERARLDTGPLCNYNCEFCYYKDRLHERDSLDTIKQRADDIHAYGIKQIDLSGGESSVEPNWFKILDYCNERFEHISCVSHGGKFADIEFLKKSKQHGLKEILFSLHGSNAELHDAITGKKGSFERIVKAIYNCNEIGIVVRINCTVYDTNHTYLATEYADLIRQMQPLELNFIALNYDLDNKEFRQYEYKAITDSIKQAIDVLIDDVKYLNVRYVPFCYMQGYERHVVNYYQHIYDVYDWNLAMFNHSVDTSIEYTAEEKLKHCYDVAKHYRIQGYHKTKECKTCKFFHICDGVENQLKQNELVPIPGVKILDVNHFRKNFYD